MDLKYPKDDLMRIGANFIGSKVINGVHWYSFINENNLLAEINNISQKIISMGEVVKNILDVKRIGADGHIVIINKDIYTRLSNEMFEKTYLTYPELPKLKSKIDIDAIKFNEYLYLKDFIVQQKNNKVDIYLYKTSGPRLNTLILNDPKTKSYYKKNITGFYLTEQDIEKANLVLAKENKKISMLEQKEMLDPKYGVRYTITITNADFIKKA